MARFCIAGCGTALKKDDGSTDYDRYFCSETCRNKDKAQRLRDQRAQMKKNGCSTCLQPILPAKTWDKLRQLAADAGIEI